MDGLNDKLNSAGNICDDDKFSLFNKTEGVVPNSNKFSVNEKDILAFYFKTLGSKLYNFN